MTQLGSQNTTNPRKVFFIYDRGELRGNDASPEDGLLFFFPNTVSGHLSFPSLFTYILSVTSVVRKQHYLTVLGSRHSSVVVALHFFIT